MVVVSPTGCSDTTTQPITVYPEPQFSFSVQPDSGCSPLLVSFPSVVGAVSYQWDFGDGDSATGPSPSHLYVNNTTNNLNYTVELIAQNSFGCLDTNYGNVLVYPSPTSNFSIDTNMGCQPLNIQVTNNSTGANSFSWDFGDGDTSSNNSALFTKTYINTSAISLFPNIQLITSTNLGCMDTSELSLEVFPFIEANFLSDSIGL